MTDEETLRGADIVARTLQRIGVERIFSVSGNHIMPIYDALIGTGIALIHARHEAACVHMADAYARTSGRVGIALVTGGPGHTNAVSALYTALAAESPLLLLSGHASTAEIGRGAFQELRQADVASPLTKASWTCGAASALSHDIARGAQLARSGRPGPVHISLPFDVLEQRLEANPALWAASVEANAISMPLTTSAARAVMEILATAKRPLILCGPTLCGVDGRAAMDRLQACAGVPVLGMESPRGINDPALGSFADVLARTDLLVLVGKPLDFTLRFGDAPAVEADCSFIVIDADAGRLARIEKAEGRRLRFSAQADAIGTLSSLISSATAPHAGASGWLMEACEAVGYRPRAWTSIASPAGGPVHPLEICAALQSFIDAHPGTTLVCDGGEFGQWPQAAVRAERRLINGVAGSIGSALPYAIGVKSARPEHRVIAVTGDGSFGFHMAEFDTALRHELPIMVVVGNDARWNAEYQIQCRDYGPARAHGCELLPSRYDRVAEALGGHGEFVTRAEELGPAIARAAASGRPSCVNVLIEPVAAPLQRRGSA
jgi:thiamine pyrophosphate-dependent acetolactate synthase large subunit-like protein